MTRGRSWSRSPRRYVPLTPPQALWGGVGRWVEKGGGKGKEDGGKGKEKGGGKEKGKEDGGKGKEKGWVREEVWHVVSRLDLIRMLTQHPRDYVYANGNWVYLGLGRPLAGPMTIRD